MAFSTSLLVLADSLRVINTLVAIVVLVGGTYLVLRPMPGIPAEVESARTVSILGTQCLLLAGIAGSVQRLGQPPSAVLLGNTVGIALLLWWLVRESRAIAGPHQPRGDS